jgi:hypothetical protein
MSNHDEKEKALNRNPHGDFKAVEASRPAYTNDAYKWVQKPNKDWKFGDGPNALFDEQDAKAKKHVEIDPYAEGRAAGSNYKLLISAVVPRPVGFCSTVGNDGVKNLAPFSYFNVINHDPPLFIFGFACGLKTPKDSLRNLMETKECKTTACRYMILNLTSNRYHQHPFSGHYRSSKLNLREPPSQRLRMDHVRPHAHRRDDRQGSSRRRSRLLY